MADVTLADIRSAIDSSNQLIERYKSEIEERYLDLGARLNKLERFGFADGTAPRGKHWMPSAAEYKAHSIGSFADGGVLVPEANAALFFDRLRPLSVVLSAGPVRYAMQTDRELIPKLGSSVTVVNPGENGTIEASTATLAVAALQTRKYAARSIGSAEWFQDANPDARSLVQQDHERSIAAALDRDFLEGSGTGNRILGLRHTPGANAVTLGSGSGAVIALDDVLAAIGRLEAANATPSAIFLHPRTWQQLRAERDANDGRYQLQPDPTSDARRQLFGVPVFVSAQISTTESTGGGDSSYVLVCDMSRVVVGTRQQLAVLVDPYSLSASDQVVIRTTTRWAMAVLDAAAVEIIGGCQPTA